jgi:peroxiredoxin
MLDKLGIPGLGPLIRWLVGGAILTLAGCASTGQPQLRLGEESPPPAIAIAARINDDVLTVTDLERELAFSRAVYRIGNDKELVLQNLAGVLENIIPTLLLDQRARAAGVTANEEEITAALHAYAANRNTTLAKLATELQHNGVTLDDFRIYIARTVRIEKYINQALAENPDLPDYATWIEQLRDQATLEIFYQPPTESPLVGGSAPDFSLPNLEGEAMSLFLLQGRPIILNFWATWCGPCRREMVLFQEASVRHQADGLIILAANFEEEAAYVRPYVKELGLTFEILYDRQAEVTKRYLVTGLPTTFFIDRQGVIRHVQIGEIEADLFPHLLEEIL